MSRCRECRFFKTREEMTSEMADGDCRLNPPTIGPREARVRGGVTAWPAVMAGDWCGRFEAGPPGSGPRPPYRTPPPL
jgi:hypothetical protein